MLRIAVVEDNEADAAMLAFATNQSGIPVELVVLQDAEKALDYLLQQGPRRCDIVLMDLNLTGIVTGLDLLRRIKSDDDLKSLPVVVFSGSSGVSDVEASYRAGANSYVCKPTRLQDILAVVRDILSYWSSSVQLPHGNQVQGSLR